MGNKFSLFCFQHEKEIKQDINHVAKVVTVVCPQCQSIIPSVVTATDGVINIIASYDGGKNKN